MTKKERELLRAVVLTLTASGTNERTHRLAELLADVDEESRPVPAPMPVETVAVEPGAISGLASMQSAPAPSTPAAASVPVTGSAALAAVKASLPPEPKTDGAA